MGFLEGLGGAALGMALAPWEDNRQIKQQEKLQGMAIKGQKEMSEFNREQAMKMWKDTNYGAQVEQMKEAGLNVGMMYGGGGAGGGSTTANVPTGNVSSGQAQQKGSESVGMGMIAASQLGMQEAQKELIQAQTNKTNVEAEKISGVDTELGRANISNITAQSIATELENKYQQEGAYKDGMSGQQVRYQREAAEVYNRIADTELKKLNFEQMPKELALKTKEVILKGQQIAINAYNADTDRKKYEVYKEMENLRVSNQMYQYETSLEQRQGERETNNVFRIVENVMSAAIPWYEPSHTTSTHTESFDDGEGGRTTSTHQTRRRN